MQTVVLEQPGRLALTDTAPPEGQLAPDEALVRVQRVGICGSDLKAFKGEMPFLSYPRILGHELGVELLDIGANDQGLQVGDRAAVEPYLNCGRCIACRRGRTNCCSELRVLGVHTDGGMRETIRVPVNKLHPSQKLSLDQLALIETLVIGAHAVRRGAPQAGEQLLVIGVGPIGLTVIAAAAATGAEIIAMDVNPARLEFAQEMPGVAHVVDARNKPLEQLNALTNGDMPTQVYDASGSAAAMNASFDTLASGGTLVFVGLVTDDISFHDPEFHRREMTIMSSRNGTAEDFRHVINLVESGAIDTTPWITHRAAPAELIRDLPGWLDPTSGCLKAMMHF